VRVYCGGIRGGRPIIPPLKDLFPVILKLFKKDIVFAEFKNTGNVGVPEN